MGEGLTDAPHFDDTNSEAYRHSCEVLSVARMYRETLQKEGKRKAGERIKLFLLQVEKHRGSECAGRLRQDALLQIRLGSEKR